jgi:hypothetical protein
MELVNHQKKNLCPYCEVLVVYDEIRTHHKLARGQPQVKVAVFRCPKCKKIASPIVPLDQ